MTNLKSVQLQFPTTEFRSHPIPGTDSSRRVKLATCYVRVDNVPEELGEWMAVNPRIPKFNQQFSV